MIKATVFEAKTKLSQYSKQVQKGEVVILPSGRDKTAVARLEAIQPSKPKKLGVLETPGFVLPPDFSNRSLKKNLSCGMARASEAPAQHM